MNFETLIFYFFAAILLFAAARVVTARNPVHSALFLVLAFFTAAALWITLEAEFLAITLVLVYVGAVMVLFLFVVMMLDINYDLLREGFWEQFALRPDGGGIDGRGNGAGAGRAQFLGEWQRRRAESCTDRATAISRNWGA